MVRLPGHAGGAALSQVPVNSAQESGPNFQVGDIVEVSIARRNSQRHVMFHGWLAEVIHVAPDPKNPLCYIDTDPPINAGRVHPQAVSFRGWFPFSELVWRADKDWRPEPET